MPKQPSFRDEGAWTSYYDQLKSESDRGCAIIGGAMIDQSLSKLIAKYLIDDQPAVDELLEPHGRPSSVYTRVSLAYCLGLVMKNQVKDIIVISRIRNYFAHNLDAASFENEEVMKMCDEIKWYFETAYATDEEKSPRKYFQVAVAMLIYNLAVQSTPLEHQKVMSPPKYPF
jgi:mannitol operon repressor